MKKIFKLSALFLLLLTSCKHKNYVYIYPIEKDENNIKLPMTSEGLIPNYESVKLYFYMSDFQHREYDYVFSHQMDIQCIKELDIRVIDNKLIISNLEETMNQTVINFEEIFPDIFNDDTKDTWIVDGLNANSVEFFSTYTITGNSNYKKTFKLQNEMNGMEFDIAIRAIGIFPTKYDLNLIHSV